MSSLVTWKQRGSIALWQYTENRGNYPGWHLSADDAGCASLIALVDLFRSGGVAASQLVTVVAPTPEVLAVPNNRAAGFVAPTELRLSYAETLSEWYFPSSMDPASLTVGDKFARQLREGVCGIPCGHGDYSIGTNRRGNLSLTFWWRVTPPNNSFKPTPLRGAA